MNKEDNSLRIAFAGFRHGHIMDVHSGALAMGMDIVACCEEDPATRDDLAKGGVVAVTHHDMLDMLDHVECDVVAVGDYYGRRGALIIEALERGKHVISDKPICTRLDELEQIERLTRDKGLSLGCQLDMRDKGQFITMRELITSGVVGEVHAITFGGQHPLLPESRPHWYFEEGRHGGTINDIGIHAFDMIPWLTGLAWDSIIAARSWNALTREFPYMRDAGQFMLRLSNGAGVVGDVSYLMPGAMGYSMPQYWRMTVWGAKGILETSMAMNGVEVALTDGQSRDLVAPAASVKFGYLSAFAGEVRGNPSPGALSTSDVMAASRWALKVEAASAIAS